MGREIALLGPALVLRARSRPRCHLWAQEVPPGPTAPSPGAAWTVLSPAPENRGCWQTQPPLQQGLQRGAPGAAVPRWDSDSMGLGTAPLARLQRCPPLCVFPTRPRPSLTLGIDRAQRGRHRAPAVSLIREGNRRLCLH